MTGRLTLSNMSNRSIANMYCSGKIYTDAAVTGKKGTILGVPHNGKYVAIQAKPIAPVEAYERWIANRNQRRRGKIKFTGAKLRRIVIMRRQGETWTECGQAVGVDGNTARRWLEFLPLELGV